MIEIRKLKTKNYLLKIEDADFLINPERLVRGSYIILTKDDLSLNRDTIFQAPGEYEVRGVYLTAFPGQTFLFQNQDFSLLFAEKTPSKVVKENLKKVTNYIPIILMTELDSISFWHQEFGSKVFVTERRLQANGFAYEEAKVVKINQRRLNHTIYFLQ